MQNNPLLPVSEARENMLKNISSLSSEKCSIEQAHNRIIAQDLTALLSHPAEAVSSMDGYAARISDIVDIPVTLPQVGISSAGHIYNKPLLSGQLVRIFTGAVIPDGCDTIILQENTKISQDGIEINERPRLEQYIRASGLDFSAGEKIISKSSKLTARECALIALAGYHEVPVIKQPKIGVLTSGDELVPPGEKPKTGQLVNSNNLLLCALIRACGGIAVDLGILPDKSGALIEHLEKYPDLDLIITTGGASVGDHDYIAKDINKSAESELYFWKIAMRPGKPLMFGHYKNIPFLGLPGNPVSAGVCSVLFLEPIIKQFLSQDPTLVFSSALITNSLPENDRREEYLRAKLLVDDEGNKQVSAASTQDSSMLANLASADCLIQRPAHSPRIEAGTPVPILNFPALF
ncbi:MAG: molybdopterin molybdotransferase MoeA [Alphaproteobacteria bacterium]|nr:molybdopterin molybdotransferase MoeA [Alphaproteobacteria bacterium]